jgi:hypothetical protein
MEGVICFEASWQKLIRQAIDLMMPVERIELPTFGLQNLHICSVVSKR